MLMAVVVALGCSRLDVVEHIGQRLGFSGAVDDLAAAEGVTVSEGIVVIDPAAPAARADPALLEQAGRAAAELVADAGLGGGLVGPEPLVDDAAGLGGVAGTAQDHAVVGVLGAHLNWQWAARQRRLNA